MSYVKNKICHLLFDVETAFHGTYDVFESDLSSTGISRDLVLSRERGRQPFLNFLWDTFTEIRLLAATRCLASSQQKSGKNEMKIR